LLSNPFRVKNGQNIGARTDLPQAEISAFAIADADSIRDDSHDTPQLCVHLDETPLYKDPFIQNGIRRVFMASVEPSPSINGKGIGLFRDAGMEVVIGIVQ